MKIDEIVTEAVKQRLDPKCWTGKHKEGTKIKGGVRVNNCVPNESVEEAANAAQQAAIAINMKKNHKKPKTEDVDTELAEEFDLIESIINRLAKHNGVDAEVIWEDLDSLTEDELYAFAVTSEPIMESQDVAEGSELKQAKRKYNQAAKDANLDQVGAGKKIDTMKKSLRQKDLGKEQGVAEATGDQKFDSMMSRMTSEPKYPDKEMIPTSIPELIRWAQVNRKPYHEYFAQWARRNGYTNVNDALEWFGDNVDPSNPWGPKDRENVFGRPAAEELQDAAEHDPKARELMKVFRCYEEIVFDWPDDYRQMNMPEDLAEEFDLIESIINQLAEHNGVDAEVIWADLETLTEDELYAFAVTSEPIMESQDVAEGSLNEFAIPGGSDGDSERWYTDNELADIIGDDWFEDFDVSNDGFNIDAYGEKAKKNLVGYANAWFNDKGYNVNVMGVEHNDVDHDLQWYIVGSFYNPRFANKGVAEDWQKANKRDKTDGMSQKAVNAYRRENPGSKLKTAVTTKPGKLKKGGKASKRRKSYCSRSRGQMKMHSISCAKTPDKAICKARRRWNC